MPRSPIDTVSDKYLESIHNKGYAEMILDELSYGTDNDRNELYQKDREYVLGIKKRLDIINMQSRSIKKKAI